MEVNNKLSNMQTEAIKNGVGMGLISFILGVIASYVIVGADSLWTISLVPILLGIIIPIVVAVFFCKDLRKKAGGYWNFRQAASGIFVMFLVSWLLATVLSFGFNKLIEKDMEKRINDKVVTLTSDFMKTQGMDDAQVELRTDEMNAAYEKKSSGTFMQQFQGYLIGIVIVFVLTLIFAAIFKKEPPIFLEEEEDTFPPAIER